MADTRNASSPRELIHMLIITMKEHKRIFDTMRERTGLGRTAHRMLMILSDNPDGCSQIQLAEILDVSAAAVAVTLKKMENDGYIMRSASPLDSRLNTAVLTEKGKNVVMQSHKAFGEIDNAMFSGFSDDEMYNFEQYIARLQDNIRNFESGKDDDI